VHGKSRLSTQPLTIFQVIGDVLPRHNSSVNHLAAWVNTWVAIPGESSCAQIEFCPKIPASHKSCRTASSSTPGFRPSD
jgi:hypothetical protein